MIAAPLVYFVAEAVSAAAWKHPPYSYAHNYISDLGVPGPPSKMSDGVAYSPLSALMKAGFILHGVLFVVAVILLRHLLSGRCFLSLGLLALRTSVPDGIFERGAVYSIFAWELFAGIALLSTLPRRTAAAIA